MLPHPVPPGVRPTASRVRAALFDLLGHDHHDVRWVDLTAGSGMIALEAWSRGAHVVAVERDGRVARALAEVVRAWGCDVDVRVGDGVALCRTLGPVDVAYVDPPYEVDPTPLGQAAAEVADCVVIEADAARSLPDALGRTRRVTARTYGAAQLAIYRVAG